MSARRLGPWINSVAIIFATIHCAAPHGKSHSAPDADRVMSSDDALSFVQQADQELKEVRIRSERIAWINETYITDDTDWLASQAAEQEMATSRRLIDAAARFHSIESRPELNSALSRQLNLLKLSASNPAPSDASLRRELAEIGTKMTSVYGKGKACLKGQSECLDLNQLSRIMSECRDFDKLQEVWEKWHLISRPIRNDYQRFVELANRGAAEIGYADVGDLWRSRYDMQPADFERDVERLWHEVQPLYRSLHCYVRKRLSEKYGPTRVPRTGPIPAHVLGNMWAQEWANIYDMVEPYPGGPSLDITRQMVTKGWDAQRMMKTGEAFFTSLGMPTLPESFWQRSMIVKPKDRDVVCHASAWDMGGTPDVRIKMCTEVTEEDLNTIHHELGHIYYYLHYTNLPTLFQQGANDGFHEGIGDTLALSVTPAYLNRLGLLTDLPSDEKAQINTLMKRALDKVAFLPFGKLVDQWRWEVYDGRIPHQGYNEGWWRLRLAYQGIVPPSPRTEADFDPGAKYHIPANVPYMRYFLAHILQFQFHRALCRASGHEGPLHTCSIYGSKKAGEKLTSMLRMGASQPWPQALAALSGERSVDATALLEFFAPLQTFLDEATRGEQCGW